MTSPESYINLHYGKHTIQEIASHLDMEEAEVMSISSKLRNRRFFTSEIRQIRKRLKRNNGQPHQTFTQHDDDNDSDDLCAIILS